MATQPAVLMKMISLVLLFQGATCLMLIPGIPNIAQNKPATQSSTLIHLNQWLSAKYAVDGNINGNIATKMGDKNTCTHTLFGTGWLWWMVDLENIYTVHSIRITNRWDCCSDRLKNFKVEISEGNPKHLKGYPGRTTAAICTTHNGTRPIPTTVTVECDEPIRGRYVRVIMMSPIRSALTLCEFEVFETPDQHVVTTPVSPELKGPNLSIHKPTKQSRTGDKNGPEGAVDEDTLGHLEKGTCAEVTVDTGWQWWMVDLEDVYTINFLGLTTRYNSYPDRLSNFTVEVSKEDPATLPGFPGKTNAAVCMSLLDAVMPPFQVPYACDQPVTGRYLRVLRYAPKGNNYLTICDFQVYEKLSPTTSPTKIRTTTPSEAQTSTSKAPTEKPSMVELWHEWQRWIKRLQKVRQTFADNCPALK